MAAHFINVGQGSAALFEFSCGLVLVDTGGQSGSVIDWQSRFADYLDGVFARRPDLNRTIDVVYLTHPHPDHTLGVSRLIADNRFSIRHVITDAETGSAGQKQLIAYANVNRIPAAKVTTDMITGPEGLWSKYIDPLRCSGPDPDINVVWGSYDQRQAWPAAEAKDANNHSVAVHISLGESTFLVTGDMEGPATKAMVARFAHKPRVLDVDVYVAGHHGSANGTDGPFVQAMTPEIAIISAGDPSAAEPGQFTAFHHGHPNRKALLALSNPTFGVSMSRPPKLVGVGVKGARPGGLAPAEFARETVSRAIFSTGWDGDIVVIADRAGSSASSSTETFRRRIGSRRTTSRSPSTWTRRHLPTRPGGGRRICRPRMGAGRRDRYWGSRCSGPGRRRRW